LSAIQADDGVLYSAAKGNTISFGKFRSPGDIGGEISSVVLHVKFSVQSGYSGTNSIRVNGVDAGIVPSSGDTQRTASVEIITGNFRINTWPEVTTLAVTFHNNDTGQGQSVQFDHAHLVVTHATPLFAPPTWSDEFDDSGPPNPSFWTFEQGFVRNEELQWYQSDNAWQENGNLIIEARREQVLNPNYNPVSSDWRENRQYADYTSASIKSSGKVSFQYGRMQVRAKIPCYTGSWPAIWTLGNTGEWPSNGECDIMEYYQVDSILANCARGTTTRWTAAWDSVKKPVSNFSAASPNWRDESHVWTMQWDQDNVRLYVDNHLMNTTPQSWLVNPVTTWGPAEPFKQPHYILLNLAIGSNGGNPANTAFPLRYLVDYVRVWEGLTTNNAPTDIALSSNSINAGLPAGTVVGTLSAADTDAAEVHAFSLVSGTGSTHNSSFEIVSVSGETQTAALKSKQVLSASDGATRSIRVRVTDIEGATYDEVMAVNVPSTGQLVIYNGNGNTGGAVPVDGNGYSSGATVTVLGNINNLTKSGFLVSGWNTSADGSGTSHAPGATFTIGGSNVTLYAMWLPDTPAGTTLYTGANGTFSTDTWNNSANWNSGAGSVPENSVNVEIASGKSPWAVNMTPAYSGNLTLRSNSMLGLGATAANNTANALGIGAITMESGSRIIMRYGAAHTFNQNIVLTGSAAVQLSESTNGQNLARTFASPVTGAHDFTLLGQNGNIANLNAANGFTSLTAAVSGSNNWKVVANAAGSLGMGDVTINNAVNLVIGQADAINPSGALHLNGVRSTKIAGENKLVLNAGLTVDEFWLDGIRKDAGTYNSSSGLVDSGGSPLISGTGTLTVTGVTGPGPVAHFEISPIASPQTAGTPITGITLTARDSSNNTAASFTGTVTFGGTGGFTGASASFTDGVLSGVSVIPTVAGTDLTFAVNDGAGHTGSVVIAAIQSMYASWSGGAAFDADANGDGLDNGMAWLLGASGKDAAALDKLPVASLHDGNLRLTFRCLKSAKRGGAVLKVQSSDDLGDAGSWTSHEAAVPDENDVVNGVVFDITDDGDFIKVIADIPASGAMHFGRLHANE
jgi:beta-glucanase (GH16 family)